MLVFLLLSLLIEVQIIKQVYVFKKRYVRLWIFQEKIKFGDTKIQKSTSNQIWKII